MSIFIDKVLLITSGTGSFCMQWSGDCGIPVLDYIEENVSTKVVKII